MLSRVGHVLIFVLALQGVCWAQKSLTVPMKWTPTEPPAAVPPIDLTNGGVYPLRVEPVLDHRGKGRAVGEHPDGKKPAVPVFSDSDIAGFVTGQLKALLDRFGVPLTTESSAKRILRVDLLDLWVVDAESYSGTARAKISISDDSNNELWSAMITGTGENGGRSLKVINYQETFSNAIQAFVVNLLRADSFQKSLKR